MGSLGSGAAWIIAVLACSLLALARSNTTLGISSDHTSKELSRQIVRLQRERDLALRSLTSLQGKLERCRRYVHACESRARTGGRPVRKRKWHPVRETSFTEPCGNQKRGACVNVTLSASKSVAFTSDQDYLFVSGRTNRDVSSSNLELESRFQSESDERHNEPPPSLSTRAPRSASRSMLMVTPSSISPARTPEHLILGSPIVLNAASKWSQFTALKDQCV